MRDFAVDYVKNRKWINDCCLFVNCMLLFPINCLSINYSWLTPQNVYVLLPYICSLAISNFAISLVSSSSAISCWRIPFFHAHSPKSSSDNYSYSNFQPWWPQLPTFLTSSGFPWHHTPIFYYPIPLGIVSASAWSKS